MQSKREKIMKKDKFIYLICMIAGLLLYTAVVAKITNCYVWKVATSNDWIGYYGSIAGGVLTLAGVYITLKNGEKT